MTGIYPGLLKALKLEHLMVTGLTLKFAADQIAGGEVRFHCCGGEETIDLFKALEADDEGAETEQDEPTSKPSRPVPVIAGSYPQYIAYLSANQLRNRVDIIYVSQPEQLLGLPYLSLVILTGSYAARSDWSAIKGSLDAMRATIESQDLDGSSMF